MKLISHLFSRRVLLIIQIIITIFFSYVLYTLDMIPLKYLIPIIILILILIIGLYRGQKNKEDKPFKTMVYKILSLFLSIVMVFGTIQFTKGSNVLDMITSVNSQVIQMSVIVLQESNIKQVKELENLVFGTCSSSDSINTNKAKAMIEDDIGKIQLQDYKTSNQLISALYNKEINAIIIKEMDRNNIEDDFGDFEEKTIVLKTYEIKIASVKADNAKVTKEPFNIFISGTDQKGSINTAGLSDVNMIATVNPVTKQILLTSIPRDYYVEIDGYNGKDKLTHSAKGGIQCTMNTIENFLGIQFNYYVKLNFTSFMNIIDALGGITIDVPVYRTLYSEDGSFTTKVKNPKTKQGYTIYPGINEFDANEALAFVRERKSFANGDKVRGQNQQLMIKAVIKKMCSPTILTKLDGIFESVANSLETNMSSEEIRSLINMQISDLATWDVVSYQLTGESIRVKEFATIPGGSSNPRGLYVMQPYEDTIIQGKQYIDTVIANQIVKIEDDK